MNLLKKFGQLILDIFFPPVCLNCRQSLDKEEKPQLVCRQCFQTIIVRRYFKEQPSFVLGAAADYQNEVVRKLIHYFKYEEFIALAELLGNIMIQYLENSLLFEEAANFDLIIPLPLHPRRQRQRGFNQAEKLAQVINRRLNLPIENQILVRTKNTLPQMSLESKKQREDNIKGAFAVKSKYGKALEKKSVIVIDDIFTSGATIKEAVKILKRAGVKKIMVLVAAET